MTAKRWQGIVSRVARSWGRTDVRSSARKRRDDAVAFGSHTHRGLSTHASGFTLLEVMVAVAILGLSLTAIFSSEAGAIKAAQRARKIRVATHMARCKMGEIEELMAREGFPLVDKEDEDACCEDAEQPGFSCAWRVDLVQLPTPIESGEEALEDEGAEDLPSSASSALKDKDPSELPTSPDQLLSGGMAGMTGGGAAGAGGDMLSQMVFGFAMPVLKPMIEQQVRRATVTVRWAEGKAQKSFDVVQFLVAPQQMAIDDLGAGFGQGVPGQQGGGQQQQGGGQQGSGQQGAGAGRSTGQGAGGTSSGRSTFGGGSR